ncbi:MAG: carbohydrate kinase [Chloroflexi bacterium]|nr:carbohydrate kinase [Chloroflexota bacterium]
MDVLCIGEALIDFVSRERGKTLISAAQYTAATGGAPANVAAGLAKLGRDARMVATVGDDTFGRKIAHDLAEVGVDCAFRYDAEHFTTLAFVKQGTGGDRDFEFASGAHDYLLPEQVQAGDVQSAQVLHFGSISFRSAVSRETTLKAIHLAREAGVVCSCDPNWRADLWEDANAGRSAMLEAVGHADILKISDADLVFLCPECAEEEEDFSEALGKIGFQGRLAAVTLGPAGAWYRAGDRMGKVSAPRILVVVETTGSGDAFAATLLDSLMTHGLDIASIPDDTLRTLVQRACAAGALTATGYGAIPSLPTPEDIDAMLRMVGTNEGSGGGNGDDV